MGKAQEKIAAAIQEEVEGDTVNAKAEALEAEIGRQVQELLATHIGNICATKAQSVSFNVKIDGGKESANIETNIGYVVGKIKDSVDGMVSFAQTEMFD